VEHRDLADAEAGLAGLEAPEVLVEGSGVREIQIGADELIIAPELLEEREAGAPTPERRTARPRVRAEEGPHSGAGDRTAPWWTSTSTHVLEGSAARRGVVAPDAGGLPAPGVLRLRHERSSAMELRRLAREPSQRASVDAPRGRARGILPGAIASVLTPAATALRYSPNPVGPAS